MEIVFRNKREDFDAFYDYCLRHTQQGQKLGWVTFGIWLMWATLVAMIIGAIMWGISEKWYIGLGWTLFMFLLGCFFHFSISGFRPVFYFGKQAYKHQEKSLTSKDLQVIQLPKTLTFDSEWLEVSNSEAIHKWRWRQVDKIARTDDFIFIHIGDMPYVFIPRRDFPSEKNFIDFANKLLEFKDKNLG